MNKVGLLFDRLHSAEIDMRDALRKVGERHGTEADVWHLLHQFATQAETRAANVREIAGQFEEDIREPHDSGVWDSVVAVMRKATADLSASRPEPGLLLLADLRRLIAGTHDLSAYWVMAGQVAQALRDRDLIGQVDTMHAQVLTQVKWLATKLKEATPQVLVAGTAPRARASGE